MKGYKMIWVILTFVFGWLLCGAWAIRMEEKNDKTVYSISENWPLYVFGLIGLAIVWLTIWPSRLRAFAKGIKAAWNQALGGQ